MVTGNSAEADLREAASLAAAFAPWRGQALDIQALAGGITNRNFIVGSTLGRHVIRLPGRRTELLGIDRAHEVVATRKAAELGIGPPMLGVLQRVGTPVTEWVAGQHLQGAAFAHRLGEVMKLLRRFHDAGPLPSHFAVHRVVEHHARDAAANGIAPPRAWHDLLALSLRIEQAFARSPQAPVACHNDLLPANLLFGPERLWLLDFEYAGMNERFFDLANLAVNLELDAAGEQSLLRLYLGHDAPWARARLQLMKLMSELREGMWAVLQQAISELDTDFAAYAEQRLASAARLAGSAEFGRWLQEAAQVPAA